YEFNIDKNRLKAYGWDYVVAATAATFPWLFVAIYFVFILSDTNVINVWKESLLVSRFAAPTSAGVLFSMLAGAGLGLTWMYKKIKILAIFDDLDTVLLLIPLKMLMVGWKWQLGVVLPHVFSFMGCMALLAQVAHPNHMALGDKLQCGDYFDFRGNLLFKQADRRSCTNSY
ncbi:MAG: hypothetical protein GWP06_00985, partial [Actinobacteria bacterium]|nr:hypothetical protein [Actinomycetota bacterium]